MAEKRVMYALFFIIALNVGLGRGQECGFENQTPYIVVPESVEVGDIVETFLSKNPSEADVGNPNFFVQKPNETHFRVEWNSTSGGVDLITTNKFPSLDQEMTGNPIYLGGIQVICKDGNLARINDIQVEFVDENNRAPEFVDMPPRLEFEATLPASGTPINWDSFFTVKDMDFESIHNQLQFSYNPLGIIQNSKFSTRVNQPTGRLDYYKFYFELDPSAKIGNETVVISASDGVKTVNVTVTITVSAVAQAPPVIEADYLSTEIEAQSGPTYRIGSFKDADSDLAVITFNVKFDDPNFEAYVDVRPGTSEPNSDIVLHVDNGVFTDPSIIRDNNYLLKFELTLEDPEGNAATQTFVIPFKKTNIVFSKSSYEFYLQNAGNTVELQTIPTDPNVVFSLEPSSSHLKFVNTNDGILSSTLSQADIDARNGEVDLFQITASLNGESATVTVVVFLGNVFTVPTTLPPATTTTTGESSSSSGETTTADTTTGTDTSTSDTGTSPPFTTSTTSSSTSDGSSSFTESPSPGITTEYPCDCSTTDPIITSPASTSSSTPLTCDPCDCDATVPVTGPTAATTDGGGIVTSPGGGSTPSSTTTIPPGSCEICECDHSGYIAGICIVAAIAVIAIVAAIAVVWKYIWLPSRTVFTPSRSQIDLESAKQNQKGIPRADSFKQFGTANSNILKKNGSQTKLNGTLRSAPRGSYASTIRSNGFVRQLDDDGGAFNSDPIAQPESQEYYVPDQPKYDEPYQDELVTRAGPDHSADNREILYDSPTNYVPPPGTEYATSATNPAVPFDPLDVPKDNIDGEKVKEPKADYEGVKFDDEVEIIEHEPDPEFQEDDEDQESASDAGSDSDEDNSTETSTNASDDDENEDHDSQNSRDENE